MRKNIERYESFLNDWLKELMEAEVEVLLEVRVEADHQARRVLKKRKRK
jgi:hypothetical protein